jgi:predicted kinase
VHEALHPQIPALVVVTGPPGTGKTTIARGLAEELRLPLLEKDTLKEIVGGALGITDRSGSQRLGAAVFDVIAAVVHDLLHRGSSVVAEGNFTARSRLLADLPACRLVQVHVDAAPDVIRERLRGRDGERHPVHYDADAADEIAARAAAGEWAELPVRGGLVRVDTTGGFPRMHDVAAEVASLLRG